MLKREKIENYSGVSPPLNACCPVLRKGFWKELDLPVGGDAPKNFIALYEYKENSGVKRSNYRTWPKFIAKVGHKWYPIESINEYLFNQIGEVLGLNMAKSSLIIAGDQLRFLSRYFLLTHDSLEHGAQIFAGYISDKELVEDIEEKGLAREFFTFKFAESAISHMFADQAKPLMENFVKMLVFDALTGNNDRHFYNWGIIKDIRGKKKPIFAPIYDSARGLFWNDSESKLVKWAENPGQIDEKIKKYAEGSKPKIGWDGLNDLNHFDLINKIFSSDSRYKDVCEKLITEKNLESVLSYIDLNFSNYYSPLRLNLIKKCLIYRFKKLIEIKNNGGIKC